MPRARWTNPLGTQDLPGSGRLFWAIVADNLGVGLFFPLSFLYFTLHAGISATQVGVAVTAASLLALPLGLPAGYLVDRFNPRVLLIANNLVSGAGYALYFLVSDATTLFIAVFVVMAADRLYWAAWPTLVSQLARREEMDRWYALTEVISNSCMGVGAVVGTLILAMGGGWAFNGLLAADVVSCLISAALLMSFRYTRRAVPDASDASAVTDAQPGTWGAVLRDRPLVVFVIAQGFIGFAWLLPTIVLPLFFVKTLELPIALSLFAFGLNWLMQLVCQTRVTAFVSRYQRSHVIAASAGILALAIVLLPLLPGAGAARVPLALAVSLLVGIATMTYVPAANSLVALAAPEQIRGRALSLFQTAVAAAGAIGPALIGTLFDLGGGYLWATLGILVAAGGAMSLGLGRSLPAHAVAGVRTERVEAST